MTANFGDPRLPDRFWAKVAPCPMSGCWLWTAALNRGGYGVHRARGGTALAHRLAFEAFNGPYGPGLVNDHLCRVRCCVNPGHMEAVTDAENTRRGLAGATKAAAFAAITHCPQGHPYDAANTQLKRIRGGRWRARRCRACASAYEKRKRQRAA